MSIERWKEVRAAIRQHRKEFAPDHPTYVRLSRLIGRVGHHINYHGDKLIPLYNIRELHGLSVIARVLRTGEKIVVFDAEWPYNPRPDRLMNEIGLVVIENGIERFHNIQIRGYQKGNFQHGYSVSMNDREAKAWLSEQMHGAKCVVGHALKNDRKQLRAWGWNFPPNTVFADTAIWSKHIYQSPNELKLVILAHRLRVMIGHRAKELHCAGNDVVLTWVVAKKIIEEAIGADHVTSVA